MVNLAFCKLDVPYLISSDNSEAHQSSISIYISLQRDGHSCWNFGIDLLRASDLVLSKWLMVFLVICCSDFVSRRDLRLLTDPEGWSVDFVDLGSWSDLLDALVSWWIFSNNRGRWFRSRPVNLFELFGFFWFFRQILFTAVPLYYFDLKSDWLPYFPFAFGSPPEDSVFFRFLFVTIR